MKDNEGNQVCPKCMCRYPASWEKDSHTCPPFLVNPQPQESEERKSQCNDCFDGECCNGGIEGCECKCAFISKNLLLKKLEEIEKEEIEGTPKTQLDVTKQSLITGWNSALQDLKDFITKKQ